MSGGLAAAVGAAVLAFLPPGFVRYDAHRVEDIPA